MRIIVMNHVNGLIEVLNVSNHLLKDDIKHFLSEHGYELNNISWMEMSMDYLPVQFREYDTCKNSGKEIHSCRSARIKDYSIYESIQEIKWREQKELIKQLRQKGNKVDENYEYSFEGEHPIIAAYYCDEPCDVIVNSVKVNKDNNLRLIVKEKNNPFDERELAPEDVFAGHLSFVTSEIA